MDQPGSQQQQQQQSCRDFILHASPSPSQYHIFFIPGNPGLVEYYAGFLEQLHQTLNFGPSSSSSSSVQFNVTGCSFTGFETETGAENAIETEFGHYYHEEDSRLYSIAEQVDISLERLREYIQNSQQKAAETETGLQKEDANEKAKAKAKVILIGHSFGTFVIAEMMKRICGQDPEHQYDNADFDIIGSILLFPPIPDIAKSPRGTKLASLLSWDYLPGIASGLANAVYSLPSSWSNTLIKYFTAFPSDALYTTRSMFGSRRGVSQALYLAKLEMEEITLSRWESAFQTIASFASSHPHPEDQQDRRKMHSIRIFFGKDDHWVDNELRDAFIYKYCDEAGPKAFGRQDLDIQARIDPSEDGDETSIVIPHDFSIRHSEHVVPYVAEYVEEIAGLSV